MTSPLLTTKLYIPPVRPVRSLVPRPRLIEKQNKGHHLGRKLNLISAPAGFGKTMLVGEPTYMEALKYIALARTLIAQGRLDETTTLLQRLLEPAEAGGHTTRAIEILMLHALALPRFA